MEVDFAGRRVVSKNKDWCTPLRIVNAVKAVFGGEVDLDPCSNVDSIVGAKREIILPEDGLSADWRPYERIYVNPPYGRDVERKTTIKDWFKKIYETHKASICEIVALVPVATNTMHWKKYVFGSASAICFLSDTRLKFRIDGSECNKGSPMACALVYWGYSDRGFRRFCDKMRELNMGYCVDCRGIEEK